jgi:hypothetical protein
LDGRIVDKVGREALGVARLVQVVQFGTESASELVGHADEVDAGRWAQCRLARAAKFCRLSKSWCTFSTAPGRRILTTSSVPSSRVAACAWPMEAHARGSGSKVAKPVLALR